MAKIILYKYVSVILKGGSVLSYGLDSEIISHEGFSFFYIYDDLGGHVRDLVINNDAILLHQTIYGKLYDDNEITQEKKNDFVEGLNELRTKEQFKEMEKKDGND